MSHCFFQASKEVKEELRNYWVDEDVKYRWDTLQRDFQCCGAWNMKTGYTDWDKYGEIGFTGRRGVPDSCCLHEEPGCGVNSVDIFTDIHAYEKIQIHGCLAIMKERLLRDIAPLLLTYIGCSVLLTLLTIISLVLAAAFVASINRKEKHENDGLGMYQPPLGQQPGRTRYDDTSINGLKYLDSGIGGQGSLRNSQHSQSPPRTPILKTGTLESTASQRASLYIEPTSESETCI